MHIMRIAWWVKGYWKACPLTVDQFTLNFASIKIVMPKKVRSFQPWSPLNANILKFNADGAARGSPGKSGIGGILRDHNRKVIGYF